MTAPEIIFIAGTVIYTIAILSLFGWQKSYSMSYYNYNQSKVWKYAFSLFCWSIAYPALMIGATPLLFVAFAFIALLGVMAAFLDTKLRYWLHMIAAYGGIIFAQLSIAIDFKQYWVNAAFIVLSLLVILFRNKLPKWKDKEGKLHSTHFFWIELLAIISIWKVLIF
jgi:hypothetical protein